MNGITLTSSKKEYDPACPIGVFDSGVGGLTVVKEIERLLPGESIVYLGDTARTPYGTRSPQRIKKLSEQNIEFLLRFDVKLVVVACNTASSVALDYLLQRFDLPTLGVVQPGARMAINSTKNNRIGVIGTEATIASSSYQKALLSLNPDVQIFAKPCPLFVPLAEEGFIKGKIPYLVVEHYLCELKEKEIDTLLLGCTHYPLLVEPIKDFLGPGVCIVDSAVGVSREVKSHLEKKKLLNAGKSWEKLYVTDSPSRFKRVGQLFLERPLEEVLVANL